MANILPWGRSSMRAMEREMSELMDEFSLPRGFRREVERLFDEESLNPRQMMRSMERLMDDFVSPPSLRRRISRLFGELGEGVSSMMGRTSFTPAIDLTEASGEYILRADLPGMRQEDIDIRIDDDNVLTVKGERQQEETKKGEGYEYTERSHGSFCRSVQLPRSIDANKVEARFQNGVLEVHVPTTETARNARRIPIGREEPRVLGGGNGGKEKERQVQSQPSGRS